MEKLKRQIETLPYDDNKREDIFACERFLSENYKVHSHNFFEIEFLIEGSGLQIINEKEYPWVPGTICFFSPTDFHEIIVKSPLRYYNISFDFEFVSKETIAQMMDIGENTFYSTDIEMEHFEKIASMLSDATKFPLIFNTEYMVSLLNSFLIRLKQMSNHVSDLNIQLPTIKQAVLFMHANFNNKISLADIAKSVHLSPAYFSELFREKNGITVSQYLLELRIDYAKKLLDSTNDSITDICFACGFTSLSNFMKNFKKITNTSPLKYRKRGKEQ